MNAAERAEQEIRAALWASPGARRCLVNLETGQWGGQIRPGMVVCQVITQGGQAGLDLHKQVVHGDLTWWPS